MTDPITILTNAGLPVPEPVEAYLHQSSVQDSYGSGRVIVRHLSDAALVALAKQAAELQAEIDEARRRAIPVVFVDGEPEGDAQKRIAELEAERDALRGVYQELVQVAAVTVAWFDAQERGRHG